MTEWEIAHGAGVFMYVRRNYVNNPAQERSKTEKTMIGTSERGQVLRLKDHV
jgi:hypothetical protein